MTLPFVDKGPTRSCLRLRVRAQALVGGLQGACGWHCGLGGLPSVPPAQCHGPLAPLPPSVFSICLWMSRSTNGLTLTACSSSRSPFLPLNPLPPDTHLLSRRMNGLEGRRGSHGHGGLCSHGARMGRPQGLAQARWALRRQMRKQS